MLYMSSFHFQLKCMFSILKEYVYTASTLAERYISLGTLSFNISGRSADVTRFLLSPFPPPNPLYPYLALQHLRPA